MKAAIALNILRVVHIVKTDKPVNTSLPPRAAFYITDITIPVSWYTVEGGNMLKYFSESMALIMNLLNAQSLKETIAQLHLLLLCVELGIRTIQLMLLLELQQDLFQVLTGPIILSLYQILLTPLKYKLMNKLSH